jgi:hypothetical protein
MPLDVTKCIYCDKPATHTVTGWVEDGVNGMYATNPVCEDHKKEAEEWQEKGCWFDTDRDWHGFLYLHDPFSEDAIMPLEVQNAA